MTDERTHTFDSVTALSSETNTRRQTVYERAKRASIDLKRDPLAFTDDELKILTGDRPKGQRTKTAHKADERTESDKEKELKKRIAELESEKKQLLQARETDSANLAKLAQLVDQAQRLQLAEHERADKAEEKLLQLEHTEITADEPAKKGFWSKLFG